MNFDVNLKKIFKGQKIDQYSEIPRAVERYQEEIKILEFLESLKIQFRFVKLIADTNAEFLSPISLKILGKTKIQRKFRDFKKLIKLQIQNYPTQPRVYLFTDLVKNYKNLYISSFQESLTILLNRSKQLLPIEIIKEQFERTKIHIGLTDPKTVKEFSLRTIASYAAEGMIFDQLSKTQYFSNCVWLNIAEVDRRTIEITNCLRRKKGLADLPMIFLNLKKFN